MALSNDVLRAIQKYAPAYDAEARSRYGISGAALLGKLVLGESGGNKKAVSPAGARYLTQFMPGTRRLLIEKYGIDPWRSADEAIHGAVLHLKGDITGSKGLEGYNPGGGQKYVDWILSQRAPSIHSRSKEGLQELSNLTDDSSSRVTVDSREATENYQQEAYNKAVRGSLLARMLSKHPEGSVLLRTGLLSPVMPDPGDFVSKGLGSRRVRLATSEGRTGARGASTRVSGGAVSSGGTLRVVGASPERIKPAVRAFAKRVSSIYGKPLTGDSGATHSKYTVDGNISQHFTGDAIDIPASGEELIRMGQAALVAAGMSRKKALKQRGGLYNVNGKQVIFATMKGGNHFDHLHLGD